MHGTARFIALCALLAATSAAQAHNLWLKPSSTILAKADWITVDAAVSNDLWVPNHFPLSIERLQVIAPDGSTVQPENVAHGKYRNTFDLNLQQTGTYRIGVVNSGVFARYRDKASGERRGWRGTPDRLSELPADAVDLQVTESIGRVETFATVGSPSTIRPADKGLELLPVTSPADLVAGEEAVFALHLDGQPAGGVEVRILRGDTPYRDAPEEIKVVTDAQGRIQVTWPQAGMYWINASVQDKQASIPQAQGRRASCSVTVEVFP